jgi:hypothetical protein
LLEFRCLEVRHVQPYHVFRCFAEPSTGRRPRDAEIRGDGHVCGGLDEIPKPMIVALLEPDCGRHGMIIGGSLTPLNPLEDIAGGPPMCDGRCRDDNSRRTMQNVRADSWAQPTTGRQTRT